MSLNKNDFEELKRIATNTYDRDKAFMQRIIAEITKIERENSTLSKENEVLKQQLAEFNK